jgi:pimeloyl-ACP methyl ester carboxylesterase
MKSGWRTLWTVLLALMLGSIPGRAYAETPILESNAPSGDFGGFDQAQYVPEARYMWLVMGQLQSPSDIDVTTFDYAAGERIKGIIFIPKNDDLITFNPSLALVGPGLPEPAQPLPFELPSGMGAVVTAGGPARSFFDIFTQIDFFQRAEVEAVAPVTGRYFMVVYGAPEGSATYALDIGIEETYAPEVLARYPINWWEVHGALRWSHWPIVLYAAAFATLIYRWLRRRWSELGRALWIIISAVITGMLYIGVLAQELHYRNGTTHPAILALLGFGLLLALLSAVAYVFTPLREYLRPAELATGRRISVPGGILHVTDDGPRGGDPVVLLHGFASSTFTWRMLRPVLIEEGYRVIAIDQLGNGASDRDASAPYTTQYQAEMMIAAAESLGIKSAHWIGHSFGGRLALQIALLNAPRVRSLTLLAPEAFATRRPGIAKAVGLPALGRALCFFSTSPMLVGLGLRAVSQQKSWVSAEAIAGYARPLHVAGTLQTQLAMSRAPKDDARLPVPAHLSSVHAPTFVLWGEKDPVFPVSDGERLSAAVVGTQLQTLPGIGHMPHEEAPAATTSAILSWLKQQP